MQEALAVYSSDELDTDEAGGGDNNVLLQLVGKRLLSDFAKQFRGADAATLARFAVGQTAGFERRRECCVRSRSTRTPELDDLVGGERRVVPARGMRRRGSPRSSRRIPPRRR